MPLANVDPSPDRSTATDEYRRTARRLRARHARDLTTLHQSLHIAARDFDARISSAKHVERPHAAFERVVATRVREPVVRYSLRMELIRAARRMGVGRFEANLIIATRQHRVVEQPAVRLVEGNERDSDRRRVRGAVLATCAAVAVIQGLIVWGGLRVLF